MMRRLIHAVFAAGLVLTPAATTAVAVTTHAAHADDWNCDDSYMPCDGSNYDYLSGNAPPPSDPVYQESLGDPEDWNVMYAEPLGDPGDPSWWNSGGSLDG